MNNCRTKWQLVAIWLMALPLTACGVSGGSVGGTVLEQGTEKPLAGVYVVVDWSGYGGGPVQSSTVCYHTEAAMTDEKGHFSTKSWRRDTVSGWERGIFGGPREVEIMVSTYKPGYIRVFKTTLFKNGDTYYLERVSPTTERGVKGFEELLRSLGGCGRIDLSDRNALPAWRAMYEELKTFPGSDRTDPNRDGYFHNRSPLEKLQYGICLTENPYRQSGYDHTATKDDEKWDRKCGMQLKN